MWVCKILPTKNAHNLHENIYYQIKVDPNAHMFLPKSLITGKFILISQY